MTKIVMLQSFLDTPNGRLTQLHQKRETFFDQIDYVQ